MKTRFSFALAALVATSASLVANEAQAADPIKLRVGTVAPEASPWGAVFKVWQKAVSQKTEGKVEIEFDWGGKAGGEETMAQKVKSGQLDGAALTSTGLSQFSPNIVALTLPGWHGGSWAKVDAAREAMMPMIEPEFSKNKVVLIGTGDVGMSRIMSIGGPVKAPNDIKAFNPFHLPGDEIGQAMLDKIGAPNRVLGITDIMSKLGGDVKVLNAPAIAAEQLQWKKKLTDVNSMVTNAGIGGLVFSAEKINGMPEELRNAVKETGAKAGKALSARIRQEDAAAYERLKGGVKVYDPSTEEVAEWNKIFGQIRSSLCGTKFKAEVCAVLK
jgi:TRAP-type transport system periplasmic protein